MLCFSTYTSPWRAMHFSLPLSDYQCLGMYLRVKGPILCLWQLWTHITVTVISVICSLREKAVLSKTITQSGHGVPFIILLSSLYMYVLVLTRLHVSSYGSHLSWVFTTCYWQNLISNTPLLHNNKNAHSMFHVGLSTTHICLGITFSAGWKRML